MKEKANRSKPRILLVGPLPPPAGGIATVVSDLLKSQLTKDFKIVHVDNSTKRPVNKKGKIDFLNVLCFIGQLFSFLGKLIYYRPHMVQIETSSGISFLKNSMFILLAKLAHRKIVISIHGSGQRFIEHYRAFPTIARTATRFLLSQCDAVRVLSEQWVNDFLSEFGLKKDIVWAIPNGVRIEDLQGKPSSARDSEGLTLLYVGWVGAEKGVFDLLESMSLLVDRGCDFNLFIVGPEIAPGDLDKTKEIVTQRRLNDRVKVLGERSRGEVLAYYRNSDIFVLPSYTEGLPMTVLEAMGSGLPVISTSVGAIPEVVEDGINGFLLKPGDINGLASSVQRLARDAGLRKQMGTRNKGKIRDQYSLEALVMAFKEMYRYLGGKP